MFCGVPLLPIPFVNVWPGNVIINFEYGRESTVTWASPSIIPPPAFALIVQSPADSS